MTGRFVAIAATAIFALAGCGGDQAASDAASPIAVIAAASAPPATQPTPAATPAPSAPSRVRVGMAVPAPEWDALFDRRQGWTGADGIYSFPLDGDERPGRGGTTFFVFSDTFIGEVSANDRRVSGSTLVNNTNAILEGSRPNPNRIAFHWPTKANGDPAAVVVPKPQGAEPTWFWPNDGLVVDGRIYFYALKIRSNGQGGAFGFETAGISLLSSPAGLRPAFSRYTQADTPLYRPAEGNRGDITYGLAVMPNTALAGAPDPDGFLYVYGLRNDPFNKKLLVARVRPGKIADFAAYRFWTGDAWSPDIAAARTVTGRVSSEFSVSPLADGRYILVFQLDTLSNKVAIRYGDSPVGPWSDYKIVYEAPETAISPDIFTYNAKAHPHLSEPGRLLISYNVNTGDFVENFTNADIYRPRFIWLPLE